MTVMETKSTTETRGVFPERDNSAEESTHPILFFDGVCGLCNHSVDWLLKHDHQAIFRFAPLQGETAQRSLPRADTLQLGSVILRVDGQIFRQSSAVVRVLWRLGILEKISGTMLWLIPKPLRDLGYRIVARNRYRWFGKKETCRMPSPEERSRFLP